MLIPDSQKFDEIYPLFPRMLLPNTPIHAS